MDIVITEWALQSYLDLRAQNVFSDQDYWNVIRPDVELLEQYPADPKFKNQKFWSVATDLAGKAIPNGFKMKWHNLGPGTVQLRLAVAMWQGEALLCRGYVKSSDAADKREMAKLKHHLLLISQGSYTRRGKL